ncbi:MAG TPA: aspartate-semialdehyde dehydrogenase, partial [Candidatus Lokiarchaeia archaeon]|nr:aspartate-semialdehyde dehydrogenase [Candidatus Lokiarchaeia archaeon]
MEKLKCAILGATGVAGQQFVDALDQHPWFQIVSLHGNSTVRQTYGQGRKGFTAKQTSPEILEMIIQSEDAVDLAEVQVIFSAVPPSAARAIEAQYAETTPVISTASTYRLEPDVSIFLPIVNGAQWELFKVQQERRGWRGFIAPGPNCTTAGLAVSLAPIYKAFGLRTVVATSMACVSGAGYPGVPAYDIIGNVIPYIPEEEGKVRRETGKILGTFDGTCIQDAPFLVDAKCNRVATLDGHMESVFIQTETPCSRDDVLEAWCTFEGDHAGMNLPNAPTPPILVFDDPYRPQTRVDLPGHGMVTMVG